MLTVGLTGGIGSGKSTTAAQLRSLGATVIDADVVAREVVEPGTPTLAAVAARFGADVVRPDGSLDRAGLATIVFGDPAALADLDRITEPAIAARVATLRAAVPSDRVTVFDMPLLVERRLWPHEHLTVVVGAEVETRVQRLVEQRGLTQEDARRRVATQATDAERRAAADVWVDNGGSRSVTEEQVRQLWASRLRPYEKNLQAGRRSLRPEQEAVVAPDPAWPEQGARLVAKITDALGDLVTDVQHIGSTSVPGLLAKDVIDLQVGVHRLADADDPPFADVLRARGFVRIPSVTEDRVHAAGDGSSAWSKRLYAGMDPGRVANVHIREAGSSGWRYALTFRDWLRAVPEARDEYARDKRRLLASTNSTTAYAAAKEPWFDQAYHRALAWADECGWTPSLG